MKPMRGRKVDLDKLIFPIYVSIKGDGIRCNIYERRCRTKSLKPFPNVYTRNLLESLPVLEGLEAELTVTEDLTDPDGFNKATSAFMRYSGEPEIFMWIFDVINGEPFYKRYEYLQSLSLPPFARVLTQSLIQTREDLDNYISQVLSQGHEGVIIRHYDSLYKFGMATIKEGQFLKFKPFEDDEAVFVGIEEGMHNINEKVVNELGRSKRSSSKEGMVPSGTAGAILGEHPLWGILKISGFKDDIASDMFNNVEKYMGQLVTFRYQVHGTMNSPRLPKFKGFRSKDDISLEETDDE